MKGVEVKDVILVAQTESEKWGEATVVNFMGEDGAYYYLVIPSKNTEEACLMDESGSQVPLKLHEIYELSREITRKAGEEYRSLLEVVSNHLAKTMEKIVTGNLSENKKRRIII